MGTTLIDLRFDAVPLVSFLERDVQKQVPFATALALTRTAALTQDAIREDLPRHFTIRSTWISKGIRATRAKKSRLVAEVGSRDAFMARQVFGGVKESVDGGLVAVPREIRKTPEQRTTRARWPGRLLSKRNHFIAPLPSGDLGVFRRMRSGLRLLYVLTDSVEVERRWPFFELAWAEIHREWPHQQIKAMIDALKTSRR